MAIQKQTKLRVADNSGALEIQCFHVIGSTGKKKAGLGDIIMCAVKKATPGAQVKKSDKVYAVVVRERGSHRRLNGSRILFDDNAAVILKSVNDFEPKGTRVFGPVANELRIKGFSKIISLAEEVV
jgi:large subunit ribosomal protein L14